MHLPTERLEAALDDLLAAPADGGTLELIVSRPAAGEREEHEEALLDPEHGVVGDNWRARGSRKTPDGSAEPDRQVTIMNARVAALLAVEPERRALAGDQLYVDLDIGVENLPPGTRLAVGEAVVEVTAPPHTGCAKFKARFGEDALRFVNSPLGKEHRFRGLNARVVVAGRVRRGDRVRKVDAPAETSR